MRPLAAEAIGTFALVLFGAGAIVVDGVSGGAVGHVGISLVFGLVVLVLVNALGDVSGAHLNPAVTIAFAAAGRFAWSRVAGYATAQAAGALAASAMHRILFPGHATLGATMPAGSALQSFVLEVLLSWFLMLVVLFVSHGSKERGLVAGMTIGAVVGLEALCAGPISGASMNPARSLAPALVSGNIAFLWIYLAAPVVGALLAVPCCRLVRSADCCSIEGACS